MSDKSIVVPLPRRAPSLPRPWVYPERGEAPETALDRAARRAAGWGVRGWRHLRGHGLGEIVGLVAAHEPAMAALDEAALSGEIVALRARLHREGLTKPAIARTFALVRELARRTLGQRHYDVQLIGGYALLRGTVAEMQTGEGKTLTATLPVAVAALAGIPVHVITVNDYLAARDAEFLAPLYTRLGLTVGTIVEATDPRERHEIYRCDVVYATNKQITFDYLRDRMLLRKTGGNLSLKMNRLHAETPVDGRLLMRGLHFAIVDEADSVLIDEARTPLIISGIGGEALETTVALEALSVARALEQDVDYRVDAERGIELTEPGLERVGELAAPLGGLWQARRRCTEFVQQALSALHLYRRDEHYLVRDGRVVIIDEFTGRTMADRYWGQGLHQMIEAKEGVASTRSRTTLAQMTYQRFFRRYRRLAGMTGTASEVAGELWQVYRLPVVRIPTNRPMRRRQWATRVFRDDESKWSAVADRAEALRRAGRPVLLGTRSVASSEAAAAALARRAIPHEVLNAAQDSNEAAVIAHAGASGAVTVATNMAGRGTDIALGAGVAERGGLHVVISELNDARRIDRQLAGRCARQGDPGSFEYWLSVEDPVLDGAGGRSPLVRVLRTSGLVRRLPGWLMWRLLRHAQGRLERAHARIRKTQLEIDRQRATVMAFSGRGE